jgi:uncharacterized protein YbjT (DUF2867 family)
VIVAVTGALGFVASHLIPRLRARGDRVVAIVRPGRDAARVEALGCEVRRAQLAEPATLGGAFEGAEGVVHLAGLSLVPSFLPALEHAGVRRGVFVSSAGVYTRLVSSGADAKRRGEAALRASTLEWVILRPSMIYGTPADRNLVRLLKWLRRSPVVFLPGGGATPQQPVHVEDLCEAILAGLDRPAAARREFDVGGPDAMPLAVLIRIAGRAVGREPLIVPLPLGPIHRLIVAARRLGLRTPISPEQVLRLRESKAVDITPAREALGLAPRKFETGIAEEARMLRELD